MLTSCFTENAQRKRLGSRRKFPCGEFYGFEPTAYSPRSHNSPQADTVELTASQDVSGTCTIPGVSPLFRPGQRSGDVVVPQGRALVNRKPYPVCLFSWRGRPSTDAPGVQISMRWVKSGAPPHQLNRRRYGAGTLSLAFQGERPVAYPRNISGVQSPDDKQHKTTQRLAVG